MHTHIWQPFFLFHSTVAPISEGTGEESDNATPKSTGEEKQLNWNQEVKMDGKLVNGNSITV